jgi:DNA repair protein RecN (Recombination protein N)
MLVRLSIDKFLLIEGQELFFDRGLNVITGETGTGKSMTFSALSFLMGEQGDYEEGTAVEAEIVLEDEEFILRREISRGRSRFYLNGLSSTQKVVKEVLSRALLFQEQDDRLRILRRDFQRDVFDKSTGAIELRREVEKIYQQLKEVEKELEQLAHLERERDLRLRILKEELKDIEKVGWSEEEYKRALEVLKKYAEGERINRLSLEGVALLDEVLIPSLKNLAKLLEGLGLNQEKESLTQIQEEFFELRKRLSNLYESWDLEEIDRLNQKVFEVQSLERRYKKSYKEVLEFAKELKEEIKRLESIELNLEELQSKRDVLRAKLREVGQRLSAKRREGKPAFVSMVMDSLKELGLEKGVFDVLFEEREGPFGFEDVRFLFSSSGGTPKDLAEVASGGEISRLALGLFLLSPVAQTYLLDEIDVGISGETSLKMAKFLKRLSSKMQIVAITHSPALASAGDKHFKTYREGNQVLIKELEGEERLQEVARLMGIINNQTLKGAVELMKEVSGV